MRFLFNNLKLSVTLTCTTVVLKLCFMMTTICEGGI
jgi:hypothetical protein